MTESEKALATLDEMVGFVPEHLRAEMERAIETVRMQQRREEQ